MCFTGKNRRESECTDGSPYTYTLKFDSCQLQRGIFMNIAKKYFFVGTTFILLLLLFSCTTTKLKSVWKDTTYNGYINSIMVVALAERYEIRKFFEREFVKQFKKLGVEAIASVDAIPEEKEVNANIILAEARNRGIAMIMVTHLVSFDDKSVDSSASSSSIFHTYYRNVSIYIARPGYYAQGIKRTQGVTLTTKLYETKAEKLVWSVTSKTLEPDLSEYNIVKSLSKVIIESLYDNTLLR